MTNDANGRHVVGQPAPGMQGASFPVANMQAVRAIAGAVASTLGPMPRDKLIATQPDKRQDDPAGSPEVEVTVATDGATILEVLPVDHPIGPLVKRMVGPERPGDTDVEGKDIHDGVTTSVVLAAALLDEAEELIELGVHPSDIRRGYDTALATATEALASLAQPLDVTGREAAEAVARSAMNGNDIGGLVDTWVPLAVDVVDYVGEPTEKSFAIRTKRTGRIDDSRLVDGAVLDRTGRADNRMPRTAEDASVLVLGGHETGGLVDPTLEREWTVGDVDATELGDLTTAFDGRRETVVSNIVTADVDVVVARQGMGAEYRAALADHGILGLRGVNRLKLAQTALATGATIVNDVTDIEAEHLGQAGRVAVRNHDPRPGRRRKRKMTIVEGCENPRSVTAMLTGTFDQGGEQLTRQLRKGAAAVAAATGHGTTHAGYLPGGGAADVAVARRVREVAPSLSSKAQLAAEAFADAVEMVPFTLAKNAGADPLSIVADIRARQTAEGPNQGYVLPGRSVGDVLEAGVLDPHATRRQTYTTATEVANLIVGIDDAVKASFSTERTDPEDTIYDSRARQVADAREGGED
jgi:chaperonin GroEL (HSP60 family)